MGLTAKQQLFITEYLIDMNGAAAMRRAGYTSKNPDVDASKLLVNPSIRKAIDNALEKKAKENGLTADMILKDLMDLKDKCLGRKPIKQSVADGEDIIEIEKYIFDSRGANGALEMLGKHFKLFTDKVEAINHNLNQEVGTLSSEDRKKRIEELKKKLDNE